MSGLTSAQPIAHPDGTYLAVLNDGSVPRFLTAGTPAAAAVPAPLRVIRSENEGATWDEVAVLDDVPGGFVASFPLGSPQAQHGPLDIFFADVAGVR